jgi:AraC-like DNA-binding protein
MRNPYPAHSRLYIGQGRLLYCGPLQHLEAHVYGTAVLHVGIYRPFRIRIAGGDWETCRGVVVPAGVRHALDMAGGVHGKLFVERDSLDFPGFGSRFPCHGKPACFWPDEETLDCFRWVYEADPDRAAVASRLDTLLSHERPARPVLDARIRRAVDLIRRDLDRNLSQESVAAVTELSPSRFLHVFREQTGVSYRRFRMWKRLLSAVEILHGADHLTRAALDAGFADAAHFSHCFRDTFGVNPAFVFRKIDRFEVAPATEGISPG